MTEAQPTVEAPRLELADALAASDRAKGWLSLGEQTLLYQMARQVAAGGIIVELGSWNGRSTIMLAAGSLAESEGHGLRRRPVRQRRGNEFALRPVPGERRPGLLPSV